MKPLIKVSNVSKRYYIGGRVFNTTFRERVNQIMSTPLRRLGGRGGAVDAGLVWALEGVDFTVHRGDVVGIIGRNGSGKSTLLKILSMITEPTAGYVELYGRFGSLLEVGTGFHPELSGRENVFLNGAILGMKREEIRRHFDEIVAFAEIEPFIDTPVKRYSSGMYLRLAFAVAAHLRAEILLIDEVLAVGDVEFQKKCLGKMEGVAKDGRTVLLVSHNMGAVAELCQRVLWLNRGRVELDGAAHEVVSGYFSKASGGSHRWERAESEQSADLEKKPAVLRSVRICQDGQVALGAVRFDKEFTAEVEYEVKVATSEMRVVLRLISEFGVTVFSSHDTDTTSDWRRARPAGLYVSACKIPGNLLRTGKLFVTVGIMRHGLWVDLEESVLLFEVTAVGNPLNPGRMGVITPVLEWDIRTISEHTHGRRR